MMFFRKWLPVIAGLICTSSLIHAADPSPDASFPELGVLRQAYPDVSFTATYDSEKEDWKITVVSGGRRTVLYRGEGRFLSLSQLAEKERYRQLIYRFPDTLADPADFTEEQIRRITRFGSTENRRTAPVSGTAFFDALYDSATRESVEKHIRAVRFLGREVRIHERIMPSLVRAEVQLRQEAEKNPEVKEFINSLGSAGGYSWRRIQDTSGRSFHSMGLAVDLLPRDWQNKVIYWNWEKNKGRSQWMLIPLSERWMPPRKVVEIFEREGFIWGGMWPVWDNMHFEYRPELIYGRVLSSSSSLNPDSRSSTGNR